MTSFSWGMASDVGRVRDGNEDFMAAVPGLFVVADGMGGHRGGEVASHLAVATLRELLEEPEEVRSTDDLVEAVQEANNRLVDMAEEEPELRGMGTTLCAMALVQADGRDLLGVVNVGDSRLYLCKEGELEQITEDHSLVATLERQGKLTRAEAAVHPQRNIVTRALGIDARVMVDSWEILPFVGDRYLLCSDGLFNEVEDARIAATLRKLADPTEAAHELVRLANEGGGRDNITCVVVDVVDDEGRDPGVDHEHGRVTHKVDGRERLLAAAAEAAPLPARDDAGQATDQVRPTRRSKLTWRVGVFTVVLVSVLALAVGAVVYSGTQTYYVGLDGDAVVIFRGQPGGVLWIDPQVEQRTDLTLSDVPPALQSEIVAGKEQSSLDDARRYVANIADQLGVTTSTTVVQDSPTGSTTPGPAATGDAGEGDA